jgi:elongator complex protein 1
MLRKNKINLNLICDINYDKFTKNVDKFIQQNMRVDYLDLFIMGLSEDESKELQFLRPRSGEDIIRRQFSEISGEKQKINEICDRMRTELENIDVNKELVLPILSTYVKKNPQELIEALYLVRDLKNSGKAIERKVIPPHLNPDTMKKEKKEKRVFYEDALEYICWLVDANKLYNVALQTFDFDLVTMVATQTQKDPREFLPYLNSLKEMEPEYMKFKVQYDLKEYELALQMISQADVKYFKEALAMIKKQRLYRQALRHYKDHPDLLKEIKIAFADYLHDRKYFEEAGLMYKYAGEYEKALISLKETPNYEMLFAVSQYLNFDKEQTQQLAVEYCEKLQKNDNYTREAGIVLAKYNGQGDEIQQKAIDLLIKSNNYFYAVEKSSEWNKMEFIEKDIKNGVKLAYELKFNDVDKRVKDYKEKLLRLKIVQHNKKHLGNINSLGVGGGTFDAEVMSQSQMSDASLVSGTSISGLSETSKLSQARVRMGKSKKKTKNKKKKRLPKEGSPFEEEMLVDYLEDTDVTKEERDEVTKLMKTLVYFGFIDESVHLHEKIEELMKLSNVKHRTIEQNDILEESPILKELYHIKDTKYDDNFIDEWKDIRFMKH